jgi:hypothetical protein
MALQGIFKCWRALREIEQGAPAVLQAAWENFPSPYEIDIEDDDALKRLLEAVVAASLARQAKT